MNNKSSNILKARERTEGWQYRALVMCDELA